MRKLLLLFTITLLILAFASCGKKNNSQTHVCSFSDWETVETPTCEEIGLRVRTCECGQRLADEIPCLGHEFNYKAGSFVTDADSPAYSYACTREGCMKVESVPASVFFYEQDATCEEAGSVKTVYRVQLGGETYEKTEESIIEPRGHDYSLSSGEWSWVGYNTASYTVYCSRDREHTHTYTAIMSESVEAATCTTAGRIIHTATVEVDGLNYTDSRNEAVGILGHAYDYANGEWIWNGYESASYVVSCKNDPLHTVTKSANATHTYVAPTCEEKGGDLYEVRVFLEGQYYTDSLTVDADALGHAYDIDSAIWEWFDDGKSAKLHLTCSLNSAHTVTLECEVKRQITDEPTCLAGGTAYSIATVSYDGVEYSDEQSFYLAPIPHDFDYSAAYWEWEDNESAVLYIPCKLGEPHGETYCAYVEKSYLAPSCELEGYEIYTATVELLNLGVVTDEKKETLPALGHDYELTSVEWLGDDMASAKIWLTCNNDSSHTYSDLDVCDKEIVRDTTCTTDGVMRHVATISYDGNSYRAEIELPILHTGHTFLGSECYVCGDPVYSEGLLFELLEDGSGYTVAGIGECTDKIISIPNVYEGLPVKEIKENAFLGNFDIEGVHISEYTVKIGSYAFSSCTSLEYIDFSDAVAEIGYNAFSYCTSLTAINLSDGIYKIRESAFYGCTSVTSLRLGSGIKDIYSWAFGGLVSLRELDLPGGLETIGDGAFGDCTALITVTIPKSLTYLSDTAFEGCLRLIEIKNLSQLDIPYGPGIDYSYTYYRLYLKNVYSDTEGESKLLTTKDGFVFYVDGNTRYLIAYTGESKSIVLPENCNGADYVLYYCSMTDVDFGEGYLFIPEAVTKIYNYAFKANRTIRIVEGAEGVVEIQGEVFYNCTELLSFTLGARLTTIGSRSFENCTRLVDVINHSGLAIVKGEYAGGYVALHAINVITDSLVTEANVYFTVDGFIFYQYGDDRYLVGYDGVGDAGFPGQLTLPGDCFGFKYAVNTGAIRAENEIHTVRIVSGVDRICTNAFPYTVSEIYISGSNPLATIETEAFALTSIEEIYLPSTLTYIGEYAFPETLKTAEFGRTAGWKGNHGLLGVESVKTETLEDSAKAAEFLLFNERYHFYIDVEE